LSGKASITRLEEHDRFASPEVLERLESDAWYVVKRKVVSPAGTIPLFGREA